jgi:hypothetical protein
VKPRLREFVVIRAKLPPRVSREDQPVVVVVDPRRVEEKRRAQWACQIAAEAFKRR